MYLQARSRTLIISACLIFIVAPAALLYRFHISSARGATLLHDALPTSTTREEGYKYVPLDGMVTVVPLNYSLNYTSSLGYIVSNAFSGQQGSGVRALLSLQCWAASFALPMYIVEPYIEKSGLSTRRMHTDIAPMTFGDIFDLRHFNNVSVGGNKPPLVSWETFVNHAPREAIVVRIHNDFTCHKDSEPHFKVVQENHSGDCFSSKWLHNHQLEEMDFCVVRIVILRGCLSRPDAISTMYRTIFEGWDPRRVTLVLRMWAAYWNNLQNTQISGSFTCDDKNGRNLQHKLRPSSRLLLEAQQYTHTFLGSRNQVAVMVRSEQAIRGFDSHLGDRLKALGACLEESADAAKTLLKKSKKVLYGSNVTVSSAGVFLTLDVGDLGSNSIDWVLGFDKYNLTNRTSEMVDRVKGFVSMLYDGQWQYENWEQSFNEVTDRASHPGYVASLQRTIASQADCLVLMGGGDFQRLALVNYLENHPKRKQFCLYLVCFTETNVRQFTKLVLETYRIKSKNSLKRFHVKNV